MSTDALTDAIAAEITADPYKAGAEMIAGKTRRMINRIRNTDQFDAEESLTYHLRLALDNDAEVYRERCEVVRDHLAARDDCPVCDGSNHVRGDENVECSHCGPSGKVKRHPNQLGERLKDWAEVLCGVESDGPLEAVPYPILAQEMLSTALAWVDWDSIAAAYIAEAEEVQ